MMRNVLLLCGGGSSEHEISLLSSEYLQQQLGLIDNVNVLKVEIKTKVGLTQKIDLSISISIRKA